MSTLEEKNHFSPSQANSREHSSYSYRPEGHSSEARVVPAYRLKKVLDTYSDTLVY